MVDTSHLAKFSRLQVASDQSEVIYKELEKLKSSLVSIKETVQTAERINSEGEILITKLCEVFEQTN